MDKGTLITASATFATQNNKLNPCAPCSFKSEVLWHGTEAEGGGRRHDRSLESVAALAWNTPRPKAVQLPERNIANSQMGISSLCHTPKCQRPGAWHTPGPDLEPALAYQSLDGFGHRGFVLRRSKHAVCLEYTAGKEVCEPCCRGV